MDKLQHGRIQPYARGGAPDQPIELMSQSGTARERLTREEAIRLATELLNASARVPVGRLTDELDVPAFYGQGRVDNNQMNEGEE